MGSDYKVIFLLLVFLLPQCVQAYVQGYGASCDNRYNLCKSWEQLTCINGACNCTNPVAMTFNEKMKSCVVKLHHSCHQEETVTRNIFPRLADNTVTGSIAVKYTRTLPCTPGTICNHYGECVLSNFGHGMNGGNGGNISLKSWDGVKGGRRLNSVGTSTPKIGRLWGSTCDYTDKTECQTEAGLKCIEGKCRCRMEMLQHFNGTSCVSYVNKICGKYDTGDEIHCTSFSSCVKTPGKEHSVCQCLPSYVAGKSGKCLSDYNTPCSTEQHCDGESLLKCVNGKCLCEDIVGKYDRSSAQCRGLAGAFCKLVDGYPHERVMALGLAISDYCVENSTCVDDGRAAAEAKVRTGTCQCKSEFRETASRSCV